MFAEIETVNIIKFYLQFKSTERADMSAKMLDVKIKTL